MPLAAAVGLCLQLAGAPDAVPRYVPAQRFSLAWQHSIEKVRWEEDYQLAPTDATESVAGIMLVEARIKGSAAGMEPPETAYLRDGWYHYQPTQQAVHELRLTRSGFTPDYELCIDQQCQPMQQYLESDGGVTLLQACMPPVSSGHALAQ